MMGVFSFFVGVTAKSCDADDEVGPSENSSREVQKSAEGLRRVAGVLFDCGPPPAILGNKKGEEVAPRKGGSVEKDTCFQYEGVQIVCVGGEGIDWVCMRNGSF